MSSRSFGRPVTTLAELREAVSAYICLAAEKLRARGCTAARLQIFVATNPFATGHRQHHESLTVSLAEPTAHSAVLLRAGLRLIPRLFRENHRYQKAGVILSDLGLADRRQGTLLESSYRENPGLMGAVDQINQRLGRGTLRFAGTGNKKKWQPRQLFSSPGYTTIWGNIPIAKA